MHSARPFARDAVLRALRPITRRQDDLRVAIGRIESRTVRGAHYESIRDAEFRVYSQFGEDGIVQYLLGKVPIQNDTFVEFGVEDYRESNTRFLAEKDGWRGLILDAGTAHIRFTRHPDFRWRYPVEAVQSFITRENIDELLSRGGISGDIGLLSVDLDGNDYWVWEAISSVSPRIVIIEYNSLFGPTAAVSVPYNPRFTRAEAHWSTLYFGASIGALHHLASKKGYRFVGCNSAGNNAFFVRADVAGSLPHLAPADGYVRSRFREGRDESGARSFVDSHTEGVRVIGHLPLVDVVSGNTVTVAEAVGDRANEG